MEFMVIRRLADGYYLYQSGYSFTPLFQDAKHFSNEENAQKICWEQSLKYYPCEVVYVSCSISNVKG